MNDLSCMEDPASKLLDWQVSAADEERLRGLVERASMQACFCMNEDMVCTQVEHYAFISIRANTTMFDSPVVRNPRSVRHAIT